MLSVAPAVLPHMPFPLSGIGRRVFSFSRDMKKPRLGSRPQRGKGNIWMNTSTVGENLQAQNIYRYDLKRPNLEVESLTDYLEFEDDPVDWLFQDSIPRRFVTLLAAPGGCGKSMFGLTLTLSALTRRTLLPSFPIEPAAGTRYFSQVIYLAGEDTAPIVASRVIAIGRLHGIPEDELRSALERLILVTERSPLMRRSEYGLEFTSFGEEIAKAIKYTTTHKNGTAATPRAHFCKPTLLVVDPLRKYLGRAATQNDNDNAGEFMSELGELARESGTAILLLHHTDAKGEKARGASAWRDESRSAFLFERKDNAVILTHDKANYAQLLPPVRLTFVPGGLKEIVLDAQGIGGDIRAWLSENKDMTVTRGGIENNKGKATQALVKQLQTTHEGVTHRDVLAAMDAGVADGSLTATETKCRNGKVAIVITAGDSK